MLDPPTIWPSHVIVSLFFIILYEGVGSISYILQIRIILKYDFYQYLKSVLKNN